MATTSSPTGSPVDPSSRRGNDTVSDTLQRLGIPRTRENWIAMNWSEEPAEWTDEHEASLPDDLQRNQGSDD